MDRASGNAPGPAFIDLLGTLSKQVYRLPAIRDVLEQQSRRLRDQAERMNGTEDPTAASAPGQTINTETARQPGGCR